MKRLLCVATAGQSGQDALRVRRLTERLPADCTHYFFDRSQSRWANHRAFWGKLQSAEWDLVYQEGTGVAGGVALIRAMRTWGQRYIVSSGDPIGGFFHVTKGPLWGWSFEAYERMLYKCSAGFIGWTPYLTGTAMKMGASRAATVEGAVDLGTFCSYETSRRRELKADYGLNPDHIVCGVVGSLTWTPRQQYCYGLELVEMLRYLKRPDVSVLIVGDGDGRSRLEERVPPDKRERVVFTGRVPEEEVVDTLNAMDVGFITQTMDALGRYRLTTKLPEYMAAGLPAAMSPAPGFYDYALNAGWSLPAAHPAATGFHRALATWVEGLSWEKIEQRRTLAPEVARKYFDYEVVRPRFESFVSDLLR